MIARWRRLVAWERVAAGLAAGVVTLGGWWLLMEALEGSGAGLSESPGGPVGLAMVGLGEWWFIRQVADGVYPDAPIVLKRAARWIAGGAVAAGLMWLAVGLAG